MKIDPNIFKAYDIRGKYPVEINEQAAEIIARATVEYLSNKYGKKKVKLLVCRDLRNSSPSLAQAVIRGIIRQGSDAVDADRGTTPFFYYLLHTVKCDGGIMITASHNPAVYNGLKIRARGSKPVSMETGLEKMMAIAIRAKWRRTKKPGNIAYAPDYRHSYIASISKRFRIEKMRAAIDASGGATALMLPLLLSKFPNFDYKPLFFQPDGGFEKHPPNPLIPEAQAHVKKALSQGGYRFGVIFDGDGDRAIFFDEKGTMVRPDHLVGLFAEEFLKSGRRGSFVFSINTSRGVHERIRDLGGRVVLSRIGYTSIQQALIKSRGIFGSEISGHYSFKDFYCDDNALLAFLHLSHILSKHNQPLSVLMRPFAKFISSGEVNFSVKDKKAVLAEIQKRYRDGRISLLDGITVEYPDWWFNVRPSNTEPVVRLVVEARDEKLFDLKKGELFELLA